MPTLPLRDAPKLNYEVLQEAQGTERSPAFCEELADLSMPKIGGVWCTVLGSSKEVT